MKFGSYAVDLVIDADGNAEWEPVRLLMSIGMAWYMYSTTSYTVPRTLDSESGSLISIYSGLT